MNTRDAVEIAELVAELWPHPAMSDTRATFFAKALQVIPDKVDAIRVVESLFVSDRRQPAPGDIIDRALGSDVCAEQQWGSIVAIAQSRAEGRSTEGIEVTPAARAALRAAGLSWRLPLDNSYQLDRARSRFTAAFTEAARSAGGLVALPQPAGVGAPVQLTAAVDTSAAARKVI